MTRTTFDIVVFGLGGVGSFALRALRQHYPHLSTLGLERYPGTDPSSNNTLGSSHGDSRIYRHAYFEHADYIPLLKYSTRDFQRLEDEVNAERTLGTEQIRILEPCGTLLVDHFVEGTNDAGTTCSRSSSNVLELALQSAKEHDIPVEPLTEKQLKLQFPQLNFDQLRHTLYQQEMKHDETAASNLQKDSPSIQLKGLWEAGGGFVRPERAMKAALEKAQELGAHIETGIEVVNLRESCEKGATHVKLSLLDGRTIVAKSVIVTAGAWAKTLLPSWDSFLTITRQIQGWINVSDSSSLFHSPTMPTWYLASQLYHPHQSQSLLPPLYGIPADPYHEDPKKQNWIKVALHGRKEIIDDPNNLDRVNIRPEDTDDLLYAAKQFLNLKGQEIELERAMSCMYTNSPDEHFLVGQPKGFKQIVAAAGLSGHGFKMVPALGRVLADLAVKRLGYDVGDAMQKDLCVKFLGPTRFASKT
jgi:sarcosine oxidase